MANIKSQKKRIRTNEIARVRNKAIRSELKTLTKHVQAAVEAGAVRETVEIIDSEDVPLQYYPGHTNRVKVKAAGDLSAAL